MAEINLLRRYPKAKRNITKPHEGQSAAKIAIAGEFGEAYFDGPREQAYGGYRYDGRWVPIAEDMVAHFGLEPGDRVLDVDCAKGFLVKDLMKVCPGLEVFGLDISEYALMHCGPEIVGRLHLGNCERMPPTSTRSTRQAELDISRPILDPFDYSSRYNNPICET